MLREPETHWSGWGYLDSNRGDEPLERAFRDWHWSRSHLPDGRAAIFYDLRMQTGEFVRNQLWFGAGTSARPEQEPIPANLPATRVWRVGRSTWADPGARPRVVRTLEDTPFYARSLLGLDLQGLPTVTVHESLHLQRLSAPGVRLMLPFRMPRRPRFLALR